MKTSNFLRQKAEHRTQKFRQGRWFPGKLSLTFPTDQGRAAGRAMWGSADPFSRRQHAPPGAPCPLLPPGASCALAPPPRLLLCPPTGCPSLLRAQPGGWVGGKGGKFLASLSRARVCTHMHTHTPTRTFVKMQILSTFSSAGSIPATAPPHWAAYSEVPRAGLLFLLPGLQKVAPTSLDPAAHRPPSRARLSGLCWDFRVVLPVPPGLPCPLGCPVAVSTGAWPCPHHSSFEGGGCEVWARLGAAAGGGPLKGT